MALGQSLPSLPLEHQLLELDIVIMKFGTLSGAANRPTASDLRVLDAVVLFAWARVGFKQRYEMNLMSKMFLGAFQQAPR